MRSTLQFLAHFHSVEGGSAKYPTNDDSGLLDECLAEAAVGRQVHTDQICGTGRREEGDEPPTSSALPRRASGLAASIATTSSSRLLAAKRGVRMRPGQMVFTRMLSPTSSIESVFANPMTPADLATEGPNCAIGYIADNAVTLTIEPPSPTHKGTAPGRAA